MEIDSPLFKNDDICKIEGPLRPLCVNKRPSLKPISLIKTLALTEIPFKSLNICKYLSVNVSGTNPALVLVIFKLN